MEGWRVKHQNRMHRGCVNAEPDGIAGTHATGHTHTEIQTHAHRFCCRRAGVHHSHRSSPTSPNAGKLAGICWGGLIVFSLNGACFCWGSLSLAWILCELRWMEAFMSCEVAVVSPATLPATRPLPQLSCWLAHLEVGLCLGFSKFQTADAYRTTSFKWVQITGLPVITVWIIKWILCM